MRHGVALLPEHSWRRSEQRWLLTERLGYAHAWTYDHLIWRWFAGRPWHSAIPTLTAAATATTRIGLGLLVATPNFRHPLPLAKELATLDDIADGRVIAGLGSGAPGHDSRILGQRALSPRERADRFDSFVTLLDAALTVGDVDRRDEWYTADAVTFHPRTGGARPRIPFAVAAAGPRGMVLAARYADMWVTSGPPNDFVARPLPEVLPVLRRQQEAVDAACERVGRDPGTLRRILLADAAVGGVTASLAAYEDATAELQSAGFTDLVVHWPRPEEPYAGDERVVVEFAEKHLKVSTCS